MIVWSMLNVKAVWVVLREVMSLQISVCAVTNPQALPR